MTAPYIAPSKPVTNGAASSGSQRDRRFMDTFFDTYRHPRFPNGRPFTGQREFQSGSQTESIAAGFLQSDLQCGEYFCDNPELGQTPEERMRTLASAWVAPWLPIGGKKYLTFDYRRKRITFDYVRGKNDEKKEYDKYFQAAAKLAGANGWGEVKYGVVPSYQVTAIMGEPTKLIPIWDAAMAGDPWLMGAVPEPNEKLAALLGLGDVQYIGGHTSDSAYIALPQAPKPEPLVKPDAILAAPTPDALAKMIAEAIAAHERAKKDERAAKMRAGKKAKAAAA